VCFGNGHQASLDSIKELLDNGSILMDEYQEALWAYLAGVEEVTSDNWSIWKEMRDER
jgi:hypothetical protein